MKETRKKWLEDGIYEYIMNNPKKDSVDIASYFKLRVDITLESLGQLVEDKKVFRIPLGGVNYGYVTKERKEWETSQLNTFF